MSRATSPTSLIPSFRFGSRSDHPQPGLGRDTHNHDIFFHRRTRKSSTQSKSNDKGKEPVNGCSSPDSYTSHIPNCGPNEASPSRYKPSYESSQPSAVTTTKKARPSLLVAASDALVSKFNRRRTSTRQPPTPVVLPDVIEISAPRRDEEDEELNRLRYMAAQAIGIRVMTKPENHSLDEEIEEKEEKEEEEEESVEHNDPLPAPDVQNHGLTNARTRDVASGFAPRSPQGSSASIVIANRHRSRSILHSRTNSVNLSLVPSFPTTFAALIQHKQSTTSLYKYYPSASLRIFALSRNWRSRFMVLSSPSAAVTRNSAPPVSYLHLFKSSSGDEKELERLEIDEESVIFVAEEDVGGRKHVVKVGGVDVGALKKELNHEGGRTMWFLYIPDPTEAQKWISVIKSAILEQRTMRAGLGLPRLGLGGIEPRGDMDVMLSMRAQGLITSSTSAGNQRPAQNTTPTTSQSDGNYASSISSHRSHATVSRSISSGAVSTFKGLFTGSTRPRSASRATSIDSQQDRELPKDDSFGSMGHHLLGSLRPNTTDGIIGSHMVNPHVNLSYAGSSLSSERYLERKIVVDRPTQWISTEPPPVSKERANKTLSLGALSLQPPPRKRWTSLGPTSQDAAIYANGDANMTGNHTVHERTETEPPSSPSSPGFSFGTPEQHPRAPSIQSVSTLASGDNNLSLERSSSSTKRSSMKRWSRQGGLPRRLTPPSSPPPLVPTSQTSASHVGAQRQSIDSPPSRDSSIHSTVSQQSVLSTLPSFSKRASGSSFLSIPGSSTSQSPSVSRPTSIQNHRLSMPPPRPAPTFALPPAPDQSGPKSDPLPPSKPSFRDSVAHRAFRLSMIAPKPPPSAVLPPRPDEVEYKSQRRNSSAGTYTYPTSLDSIPASPVPPALTLSPFPPPMGPLPPTPLISPPATSSPSRPTSRHASIKQRLRILSAPSPAAPVVNQSWNETHQRPSTATAIPSLPQSPPATPIAQKITHYQNDPSFLQLHTPVTPYLPPPRALPSLPEPHAQVTSLSPPPRRGSKQMSVIEVGSESPATEEKPLDGEHRMMSLSRPGSVISLGIVNV